MSRMVITLVILGLTFVQEGVANAANGSIAGRVSASDKIITDFLGVQVFIPGTSFISRADWGGNFHISNVPSGTYDVKISPPNDTQIGVMGEARVTGVVVRPDSTTTIYPTMVPVIPKLLKVEPIIIDRDTSLRIQGENLSADRFRYPCTVYFWGKMANPQSYSWLDARNFEISASEVASLRKQIGEGKVEVNAYCMGAWSNPLQVEFRKTAAPTPPVATYTGAPTGVFSPAKAMVGDMVTLSGQAKPGSSMSVYFNGKTHVGVAKVDQNGRYSLGFKVPSSAGPGKAYVAAGCDTCGNGWNNFQGLTVNASAAVGAPVRPSGVFAPARTKVGNTVTLSGEAKPGSFMSVYFNGQTHVGVAQVDQSGRYSLAFKVPPAARTGNAYVAAGCDTCGNNWNTFRGLLVE